MVSLRMGLIVVGFLAAAPALTQASAGTAPPDRAAAAAAAPAPSSCTGWEARTILSGQGWLENLAFDGRRSIVVSALSKSSLLRVVPGGRVSTFVPGVVGPGAQVVRGNRLYVNTGDLAAATPTGTIDRVDLRTGRRSAWARGLTAPNGLALLRNGDAIVSRTAGAGTGLTRVAAGDPAHPQFGWAALDDTNGLAVDPQGRWLYVARTLSPDGEIDRVSIAHPRRVQVVGRLGAGVAPDDLTIDAKGRLLIAGFGSGKVHRLDPRTHAACVVASGLQQPTSVRFGGPGWHRDALYVTDAGGHLTELRPKGPALSGRPRRPRGG